MVLQTPFDKGSFGNDLLPAARPRPAGGSYYRKPVGIAGRAPLFWALRFRLALVANPLTWLVLASQSVNGVRLPHPLNYPIIYSQTWSEGTQIYGILKN